MAKPSILIVPGSFARPGLYDNIIEPIADKGYEIRGLHCPTVGLKAGPRAKTLPTMYDDAAYIAKEIAILADEGKDVILMAHSYGGVPSTQCTKGVTKMERQRQGKKGGLIRIAYMTCLVPPVGGSAGSVLTEIPDENRIDFTVDEEGWLHWADPPAAAALVISDLPDQEERMALAEKFDIHSSISFGNELTHPGYKDVAVSYLLCEDDLIIPPKAQQAGIDIIEKESGRKVDVTYLRAGHCPTVMKPQSVIDWIIDAVEKSEDL